jgi:hypothetical protein
MKISCNTSSAAAVSWSTRKAAVVMPRLAVFCKESISRGGEAASGR